MNRVSTVLVFAALIGLGAAAPVRADIVGSLVNKLMDTILRGGSPEVRPDPAANLRTIPENARSGVMSPPNGRLVRIDGEDLLLAPGSKIRDLNNRIVMPSTLVRPLPVRYTVDHNAQVHLVWLLAER